jgi:tRNA 2-thiouridine synthesizing protein A
MLEQATIRTLCRHKRRARLEPKVTAKTPLDRGHCDMSIVVVTMQQKTYILVRCVKFMDFRYIDSVSTTTNPAEQSMSDTTFDSEIMEFQKELDARGLNCPLPILKAKKALAEMATGEVLKIVATDSGSVRDFQAFAKQTGNALLSHSQNGYEFTFLMRRK